LLSPHGENGDDTERKRDKLGDIEREVRSGELGLNPITREAFPAGFASFSKNAIFTVQ
jgi:hypothetical protein